MNKHQYKKSLRGYHLVLIEVYATKFFIYRIQFSVKFITSFKNPFYIKGEAFKLNSFTLPLICGGLARI